MWGACRSIPAGGVRELFLRALWRGGCYLECGARGLAITHREKSVRERSKRVPGGYAGHHARHGAGRHGLAAHLRIVARSALARRRHGGGMIGVAPVRMRYGRSFSWSLVLARAHGAGQAGVEGEQGEREGSEPSHGWPENKAQRTAPPSTRRARSMPGDSSSTDARLTTLCVRATVMREPRV